MLAMASQRSDGSFVKKDDPLSHALATLGHDLVTAHYPRCSLLSLLATHYSLYSLYSLLTTHYSL